MSQRLNPLISAGSTDACKLFLDHFRMDASARDPMFLQRVVHNFSKIPYENLSKIVKTAGGGDPRIHFRLPDELMRDHVDYRLGGTCFSLTFFLETLLTHLGYSCYKVMADMQAGRNIHCAVVVTEPSGTLLVDPGYGLNRPVLLNRDHPVRFLSRHGGVEVVYEPASDQFHLFTYMARERKWRYSFADRAVSDEDFERFWVESFSKPTLNQICLYKVTQQGRLYLHRHHLRVSTFRGQRKENVRENLHRTVKTYFGIAPHWVDEAVAVLAERRARWRAAADTQRHG